MEYFAINLGTELTYKITISCKAPKTLPLCKKLKQQKIKLNLQLFFKKNCILICILKNYIAWL